VLCLWLLDPDTLTHTPQSFYLPSSSQGKEKREKRKLVTLGRVERAGNTKSEQILEIPLETFEQQIIIVSLCVFSLTSFNH
jgi:hypothetical protein